MKTLSIIKKKKDKVNIIILDGILNADTASKLDDLLKELSGSDCPCLVLDVSKLTYISSAGIGCFIGIIKLIRSKGGDIHFYNMLPKVWRVFKLLDMDGFFKFFTDFEKAVTNFDDMNK
ncbi:MAG: STAS domain-containing protein [Deltaproteobacteria bacterium]|nr:STAS domain-containing protein [Deltaproteobacteria bacterium]